jgi:general secretion pathway protein K
MTNRTYGSGLTLSCQQRGVVLVFVLILIVLLSIMAASFSASMRSDAALVANNKSRMQSTATVDAAVAYAKIMLTQTSPTQRWRADGSRYTLAFNGTSIGITLQDESGKFDLNHIDKMMLLRVFERIGVVDDQALRLSDSILDWRDEDEQARSYGIEQGLSNSGQAYKAANRPFKTLQELTQVSGVTDLIYRQLRPYLSVKNRLQAVDLGVAPRHIVELLPDIDSAWLDQLLLTRSIDNSNPDPLALPPSTVKYASIKTAQRGRFVSVTVEDERGGKLPTSTTVLLQRNSTRVFPLFIELERNLGNG